MLCRSASTVIFRSMPMLPAFHLRYQNGQEEFFFRWASQNIQYQILAAVNEGSKRLIPCGSGIEPTVHQKLLPQTFREAQSLFGNFVTLQKVGILSFLPCTELQHCLSQQNWVSVIFHPCWMQTFNPMNQECCDCLVTWRKPADMVRTELLSKAMLRRRSLEECLWLQSCTGHFSAWKLKDCLVDRSQRKLQTQACGVLVQDWSCATTVWSWYLFCNERGEDHAQSMRLHIKVSRKGQ